MTDPRRPYRNQVVYDTKTAMTAHPEAPQLYLASASPRRRQLLDQIGVRYRILPVEIDETPLAGEPPRVYAVRMALSKARAAGRPPGGPPVLAADTVVTLDGDILGQPAGREEALAMLARLSGRTHRVITAVGVVDDRGEAVEAVTSRVTFRSVARDEAEAYWAGGEPAGKAGGYAIQGYAAVFVARLEGSYSGVVGLPLFETARLLRARGVTAPPPAVAQARRAP